MSDEVETKQQQPEQPDTPAVAKNTDTEPAEHMIPKSRFDEVNSKLKELLAEQERRQKEQQEAEEARMEEENKWKELAEKRAAELEAMKPVKQTAEQYEAALSKFLEREKEGLPEPILSLLEGRAVTEQLEWLAENKDAVVQQPKQVPNVNGTAGGGGKQQMTEAEVEELAAVYGLSPTILKKQLGV